MSEETTPKKPSHHAFQVSDGPEDKSYFNRIGAAFEHRDKKGYNILLDAVPVDGKVTLRTPQERLEQAQEGNAGNSDQAQAQEIEQ